MNWKLKRKRKKSSNPSCFQNSGFKVVSEVLLHWEDPGCALCFPTFLSRGKRQFLSVFPQDEHKDHKDIRPIWVSAAPSDGSFLCCSQLWHLLGSICIPLEAFLLFHLCGSLCSKEKKKKGMYKSCVYTKAALESAFFFSLLSFGCNEEGKLFTRSQLYFTKSALNWFCLAVLSSFSSFSLAISYASQ